MLMKVNSASVLGKRHGRAVDVKARQCLEKFLLNAFLTNVKCLFLYKLIIPFHH